ncbi:MAG: biopolymer transporter ExbD [Gammaproteobacteria bacterium]|jgi:biopolymer transport protein ExbD|nr:biopolymer transporter ExbD [Gammaproteobacteria bacterium]
MSRRIHRRKHPAVELNITAFMNLMVVLVPFLLMTAVFTHIAIIDLNLPPPGAADKQQPKQPPYELRVTIRSNMLVISDNRIGGIKRIPTKAGKHDFASLRQTLKQVKARIPEHSNVTILAEQQTPYDDLIRTMDSSRSYRAQVNGEWVFAELFPEISIGDAAK